MKVYASRKLCNELYKHETEEDVRNRRYHTTARLRSIR